MGTKGKKETFLDPLTDTAMKMNLEWIQDWGRNAVDMSPIMIYFEFAKSMFIGDVIWEYSVSLSQITVTLSDAVLSWFYITFLRYPVILGGGTVN